MASSTGYGKIAKCVQARIFEHPTIQSGLVGLVPKGERVMLLGLDKNPTYFYNIVTEDGKRGYVMQPFVERLPIPSRQELPVEEIGA